MNSSPILPNTGSLYHAKSTVELSLEHGHTHGKFYYYRLKVYLEKSSQLSITPQSGQLMSIFRQRKGEVPRTRVSQCALEGFCRAVRVTGAQKEQGQCLGLAGVGLSASETRALRKKVEIFGLLRARRASELQASGCLWGNLSLGAGPLGGVPVARRVSGVHGAS